MRASTRPDPGVASARKRLRILTWASVASMAVAIALMIPAASLLAAGALGFAIAGLALALAARSTGRSHVADFDGRLSLVSALASGALILYLGPAFWVSIQMAIAQTS